MIKFIISFLFYSVMLVNAFDIESLKQRNVEKVIKCTEDIPVPLEVMEKFTKLQIPETEDTKCLLACTFKALGVMDNQGMLSVEGVTELGRIFMSEDPERPKQAKQFSDACLSVNDIEVSDGDKGCERAALMFVCGAEKAPEFDFI